MRSAIGIGILLTATTAAPIAQQQLDQFVIARHSYVDFGPPFDFYELYFVRMNGTGALIRRITLIPHGASCLAPARVEASSGSMNESPSELLTPISPCTLRSSALRAEVKPRGRQILVFSGERVAIQVRCGNKTKIFRDEILEQEMLSEPSGGGRAPGVQGVLQALDASVGPGILQTEKMFSLPEAPGTRPGEPGDAEDLRDVAAGKYDRLFKDAPDKASDLYRQAQIPPLDPIIHLASSLPVQPQVFVSPSYPVIARMAHVGGVVAFTADVGPDGSLNHTVIVSGPPLLRNAALSAIANWRYPSGIGGQKIEASIEFQPNCPANTGLPRAR